MARSPLNCSQAHINSKLLDEMSREAEHSKRGIPWPWPSLSYHRHAQTHVANADIHYIQLYSDVQIILWTNRCTCALLDVGSKCSTLFAKVYLKSASEVHENMTGLAIYIVFALWRRVAWAKQHRITMAKYLFSSAAIAWVLASTCNMHIASCICTELLDGDNE